MADMPHVLKSIRNLLISGQLLVLPLDIFIKQDSDLKLVPNLTDNCINVNHYNKMKVGPAYALLNHNVAVAIKHYVNAGKIEKNALTTVGL